MASSGRNALVHFDDERTKIVTVFGVPEVGKELDGDIPEGWIADKVEARGDEIKGQSISVEVWVHRAREFAVLLVHRDDNLVDSVHMYRGEALPDVNQVITVETALSAVPATPPMRRRARVTRIIPDDAFPIRAMGELES